jgi:hypothetical protein
MSAELVIDHTARAHSPVGGSSAKRVMNCTASVELCAKYPNKTSEFAEEGTACHEATDLIMQDKTEKDSDVVGLTFNGRVMTQELYEETVQPALEIFDRLQDELGGIDFLNEQRVTFPGIDNAFGTVDIVGTSRDRSLVIDWKYGRGVAVEAEANEQLMYYAYAAAHTPATARFFDRHKPIEMIIIQPRVNDGEPFTRWMTSMAQLDVFALELKKAVEIAMSPDAEFKLGSWCKFCAAQAGCPLYNNMADDMLALSRDELVAQMAERLPYADAMIKLGESIKEMAHALLEQGASIPGYKLVNKRANRSWKDDEKALKYFAKIGLPAAERHVKKLISPAQAETALKRHGLPAELPAQLVDKVSSGTTLAPESDKRQAVAIAPEAFKLLAERLSAS